MNLKFWKKKQMPEESDNNATDGTIVAMETDQMPAKPGFLARLKSTLIPSRKKDKIAESEENSEELKPSDERTDRKHREEEPAPATPPAEKPGKRLVIALALLIPLAAGGGFFAATQLLPPPQHKETPPTKGAALQEVKIKLQTAPEPTDTAAPPAAEATEPPAETPVAERSARSSAIPRGGVLIISDKDSKESVQGLKKIIEEMNGTSGAKDTKKE
jgi:hypothetical protein